MNFLIDSAKLEEIEEAMSLGFVNRVVSGPQSAAILPAISE